MSVKGLKRDIEAVRRALSMEPNPNYRFSTWGEFNETYLIFLNPEEFDAYKRIRIKFAVIHEFAKQGRVPSIHGDVEHFREIVNEMTEEVKI